MMNSRNLVFVLISVYAWSWSVTNGASDVWFSLRNTTYHNNGVVTWEDIGEGDDALLCKTNQTACCRPPYTGDAIGNWYFPNRTKVPSPGAQWDFHRTRGQMVVLLHRRRGGEEGIYHCEIPDAMNVTQTIYIGVYSASTDAGSPTVTGLTYDDRSRTLTCTSTGGPATTVTWRRDGVVITLNATYQQTKSLVDSVTSTYQTVLTIDPSLHYSRVVGTYNCTVENDRGESSETVAIPGDVWFSLRGTTYQNNSIVILEDIGEYDDALLCITTLTDCCQLSYNGSALGNWFFPNGTRVPSRFANAASGERWNFYRDRGQMVVRMHRRRGGEEGIYRCEIPDAIYVIQTIYIGVYSASTGSPSVTALTYDDQSRTLTCTSTGGPPVSVTWRRDGVVITLNATYQQTKSLVDPVNGTYQTVLTIDPSLHYSHVVGIYNCTVENDRGGSSETVVVPGAGDVWFSLRNRTYQNNSIMILEDIGEYDDALLCKTNLTACCRPPYTGVNGSALGNWYFPNETRVLSAGAQGDIYRTRGQMVVALHRRRGGVEGIYHCEIPDAMNVNQTIYIGVYSVSTGSPTVTGLTYDDQSRTLTCTSTGGPATTVTWRRDGVVITLGATYQQTKSLVDSVTSTYQTVLTIDTTLHYSHVVGTYNCTVENDRGGSSETVVVPGAADVWFSLRNTTYRNNSIVILEDIGEGDDALLCKTNQTACCRPPYTGEMGPPALGNWYFPNETRVPSRFANATSGERWDIYRTRGQMVVRMHRRRGGVEGIYRCEIPDHSMNVNWTIYIGVYSANTGAGDVWFSLRGTPYQNNSIVILEDIGEGDDDALLCMTNLTACCRPPYTGDVGPALGNWYFPNETRVLSPGEEWDITRTRGQMVVHMHRRRGGVEGIYRCVIPDTMNVNQTIYIGVYSASTDAGSPSVTGLTYDDQSRTLTCTSTGGPATTVTWRRDGVVITLNVTYQQIKSLVDSVTSTYQTVLTIDPSLHYSRVVGTYNCAVKNDRGESSETVVVPGAGDVWFSLRNTTYQNNSIVILEDIGEYDDDALLCMTNLNACCRRPYTGENISALGNWFFPNETRVPSRGEPWGFYRTRAEMVVFLHRRRGGVEGIYRCEIPDTMNVNQTIYIGVYSANTGSPTVTGLTYDDLSRTLTCTSTGGPATTVTWRRNGITLNATYQRTKSLVDSVTSTYQTVLTIDPSLNQSGIVGTYSCTVENDRGEFSETVVIPPVPESPTVEILSSPSPSATIDLPPAENTNSVIGLSVGLSLGVLLIAVVLTLMITILCVQTSRKKETNPSDAYEVSRDAYEIMDLPQLPSGSDLEQSHEYAVLEPQTLPSHSDTITTDMNLAYASSIQTQPNTAYANTNVS